VEGGRNDAQVVKIHQATPRTLYLEPYTLNLFDMNFKNFEWRILIRVLFLFITLSFTSFLVVKQWYVYLLIAAPVIIYQLIDIFRFQKKAQDELNEFVESVHYRDFSRYFDVKHAPIELQPLRKGFNEINTTFKVISKEKETQYQYLQKILELVDTGILSYEEETGLVVWMNESLKKMMQLPYLKTIHSMERRDDGLYREILTLKPGISKIASAHFEKTSFKHHISTSRTRKCRKLLMLILDLTHLDFICNLIFSETIVSLERRQLN